MIRLFFRFLKFIVLVGGVLWFGQTPLGDSTIAGQFRTWGTRWWKGDLKKEVRREVSAELRKQLKKPVEWIKKSPRVTRLYPSKKGVAFDEKISEGDREALRRLLEGEKTQ